MPKLSFSADDKTYVKGDAYNLRFDGSTVR